MPQDQSFSFQFLVFRRTAFLRSGQKAAGSNPNAVQFDLGVLTLGREGADQWLCFIFRPRAARRFAFVSKGHAIMMRVLRSLRSVSGRYLAPRASSMCSGKLASAPHPLAEKAVALSGRPIRDERTGACNHFALHSDPYVPHTKVHGEEGKAAAPTTT